MVRLLGVSIRQALRSLTIALLPLAFIALRSEEHTSELQSH